MRVLVSEKLSPHRFKTPEGYLICTDAILARTGKQTYRRREVFGDMSDKGEEEIEINRDEKEVFNPATLASFENKPLTIEHPNEDVNPENHHDYAVGFTRDIKRGRIDGNDVMLGTIVVTDAKAIEDIESGELVELSCGYDCDVIDEENPQQRNIRGNHVALCEHGRAGIARIVDSVNDVIKAKDMKFEIYVRNQFGVYKVVDWEAVSAEAAKNEFLEMNPKYKKVGTIEARLKSKDSINDSELNKFKVQLQQLSKMHADDPGIEYVQKVLKNLGYDTRIDSIDGWKENRNVPGEHIKTYRMNVILDGKEHHFIVMLYADMGVWKVKEINAYMLDSTSGALKLNNCSGYAIVEKKKFDQYGINANVEARTDSLSEAKYILGRYNSQGYYIIINCKTMKTEDSVKDMDYSKESKQGFKVLEMYRDGGRLHAILKRANDFVVALGYDTTDGTWAQGRYVDKYENALATLKEEKPGAVKIQDCVKDEEVSIKAGMKLKNGSNILVVESNDGEYAIVKSFDGKRYKYNTYDLAENIKMSPQWSIVHDAKDSLKTFKVKYTKDSKTRIYNVKAKSFDDAIKAIKDLQPGVMTRQEAENVVRIIANNFAKKFQNSWQPGLVYIDTWRDGYNVVSDKVDLTKFKDLLKDYNISKSVIVKK